MRPAAVLVICGCVLGAPARGSAADGSRPSSGPSRDGADAFPLKYDASRHPSLKWGFNDLNMDGRPDTLITRWNGKTMAFVSDSGRLPWSDGEDRDWNAYFNEAFNVGAEPPVTWNPMRSGWGGYAILVDRDDSGRFDDVGDWYYKVLDLNGDGDPEGEFYHAYPDRRRCSKLHINLNGEREMSSLNWKDFWYGYENQSLAGGKFVMNVHGSGLFMNVYAPEVQTGIENPLAWYDFDCDGFNNMSMRCSDAHLEDGTRTRHRGRYERIGIAFELNGNTSEKRWHSLDMQMIFLGDQRFRKGGKGGGPGGLEYRHIVDRIPGIEGLKDAEFLSEGMRKTRLEILRRYLPYMDAYKIATDFEGWTSVWLLFDEDDDDCRWEEMFSRYDPGNFVLSDRIGDRYERDTYYKGKGKLYVGKFDGRIHLYHADFAQWDVDALAWYKGEEAYFSTTTDRPDDGPQPPVGLRYPRVRYTDTDGNGFIDKIEYMTVEYTGKIGTEGPTEKIDRVISLLGFADEENPEPDVCELIDPRVATPISGWSIATWNGRPLQPKDFDGTPVKAAFDKMYALYGQASENMWADATRLHEVAEKLGLNKSQDLDRVPIKRPTWDELKQRTTLDVPKGYSRHLSGGSRREKYNNGFWLKEKVFTDILEHSGLDRPILEKLYYTGMIHQLCEFVVANYRKR